MGKNKNIRHGSVIRAFTVSIVIHIVIYQYIYSHLSSALKLMCMCLCVPLCACVQLPHKYLHLDFPQRALNGPKLRSFTKLHILINGNYYLCMLWGFFPNISTKHKIWKAIFLTFVMANHSCEISFLFDSIP